MQGKKPGSAEENEQAAGILRTYRLCHTNTLLPLLQQTYNLGDNHSHFLRWELVWWRHVACKFSLSESCADLLHRYGGWKNWAKKDSFHWLWKKGRKAGWAAAFGLSLAADGCRVRGTLAKPGCYFRKEVYQSIASYGSMGCLHNVVVWWCISRRNFVIAIHFEEGFKGHEKAIERLPTLDVNIYCFVADGLPIIEVGIVPALHAQSCTFSEKTKLICS